MQTYRYWPHGTRFVGFRLFGATLMKPVAILPIRCLPLIDNEAQRGHNAGQLRTLPKFTEVVVSLMDRKQPQFQPEWHESRSDGLR